MVVYLFLIKLKMTFTLLIYMYLFLLRSTGKDLSSKSETDLNCIFGKRSRLEKDQEQVKFKETF